MPKVPSAGRELTRRLSSRNPTTTPNESKYGSLRANVATTPKKSEKGSLESKKTEKTEDSVKMRT
ncbi:hypothetical protein PIB30_082426 [Stylosanthes scabra]|uniref:Uncharacterized protein n=1 Tax=Stylosanthes scabra TaxID=79078 RepID=A0ABU6TRI7_9FABA|nr:hypothetical protein [Stylosanthes scabra]